MDAVNVSSLKNNPGEALRLARKDIVVIFNRDQPDAVLVGLQHAGVLEIGGVRQALATALFRDGHLSLARGARLAHMALGEFASHISRAGIPVNNLEASKAEQDMDTLQAWLGSS